MSCVRWQPSSAGTPCAQRWRGNCCKGKEIGSGIHQPHFFGGVFLVWELLPEATKQLYKIEICLKIIWRFCKMIQLRFPWWTQKTLPKQPETWLQDRNLWRKIWLLKVFLKFASLDEPLYLAAFCQAFDRQSQAGFLRTFLFGGKKRMFFSIFFPGKQIGMVSVFSIHKELCLVHECFGQTSAVASFFLCVWSGLVHFLQLA